MHSEAASCPGCAGYTQNLQDVENLQVAQAAQLAQVARRSPNVHRTHKLHAKAASRKCELPVAEGFCKIPGSPGCTLKHRRHIQAQVRTGSPKLHAQDASCTSASHQLHWDSARFRLKLEFVQVAPCALHSEGDKSHKVQLTHGGPKGTQKAKLQKLHKLQVAPQSAKLPSCQRCGLHAEAPSTRKPNVARPSCKLQAQAPSCTGLLQDSG